MSKQQNLQLNFSLLNQHGKLCNLEENLGKKVIICFSFNNNLNSSIEIAKIFEENYLYFKENNIVVYIINSETVENNLKFAKTHKLSYDILFDEAYKITYQYKSTMERDVMKRTVLMPVRSVFIVDEKGSLLKKWLPLPEIKTIHEIIAYLKK